MDGPYGEGFPPPGSANLPHILNMSVPTWTSLDDERRVAVLEQKLLEMDDEQAHRDKVASNMNTLHTKQLEKRLRILAAQTKQAQVRCSLHGVTLGLLLAILLPTATFRSLSSSPTPPTRFLGRALFISGTQRRSGSSPFRRASQHFTDSRLPILLLVNAAAGGGLVVRRRKNVGQPSEPFL